MTEHHLSVKAQAGYVLSVQAHSGVERANYLACFFYFTKGVVMKKLILLLSVVVLFCGCSAVHERKVPFDESEYKSYMNSGNATIEGQAFLNDGMGGANYANKSKVILKPVTSYSTEWFQYAIKKGKVLTGDHSNSGKYTRTSVTDDYGNFKFSNLPAGEYYVACLVTYDGIFLGLSSATTHTYNSWVYANVKVSAGEVVKIIATR